LNKKQETLLPSNMTYAKFHLIFNVPLLLLLAFWPGQALAHPPFFIPCLVLLTVVMIFTTPWDNFAVAKGIWGFPRERFSFRIGWLPVEEYAFFIIQSLHVMLLQVLLLRAFPPAASLLEIDVTAPCVWVPCGLFFGAWIIYGVAKRTLPRRLPRYHYAWHLLYWFLPVILLQWIIAWPIFLTRLHFILIPTLLIGTWLSFADYIAIGKGIWHFDEKQITGVKFRGLMPWKEIAFFYLTSLLVSQSFPMLIPESVH